MTNQAIEQLTQLFTQILFVPVTTRTIEQYRRITIFQKLVPKYAVTSNGGNILIDGLPDQDWNRHIRQLLQHECMPIKDIIARFNQLKQESWFMSGRIADELFYYAVVNRELMPVEDITFYGQWAKKQGWHLSIQGRKIYLVPAIVNKGNALKYIQDREQSAKLVAAGDSLLDLDMLLLADYPLVPPHGEIYRSICEGLLSRSKLNFTKETGIRSSEEILERVADYFRSLDLIN